MAAACAGCRGHGAAYVAAMLTRLSLASLLLAGSPAVAQSTGLTLFSPNGPNQTQLVDAQGRIVHAWPSNGPTVHILDDGSLLRGAVAATGIPGTTGRLERLSFDGTMQWDLIVNDAIRSMHHDIEPMPNGNVLVIAWDRMTVADAIAAGRDPALITGTDWLPDSLLEIEPTGPTTGDIVWEWHLMDHIIQDFDSTKPNFGVVGDHPELLDINFPAVVLSNGDWNHANGIDYDPINDWIIFSSRDQGELYLIDHSTTTAEAAGHTGGLRGKGGDILYRWGNPQAYDAGSFLNQQLNGQHDPRFVPPGYPGEGNITVFNNIYFPGRSAVLEIELPLDMSGNIVLDPVSGVYGPATPTWVFTEPGFFSQFVSGAQRLANGNTLICSGMQQRLFEVTPTGDTVWSHRHLGNGIIFQAHRTDRSLWAASDTVSINGGQLTSTCGSTRAVKTSHTCCLARCRVPAQAPRFPVACSCRSIPMRSRC